MLTQMLTQTWARAPSAAQHAAGFAACAARIALHRAADVAAVEVEVLSPRDRLEADFDGGGGEEGFGFSGKQGQAGLPVRRRRLREFAGSVVGGQVLNLAADGICNKRAEGQAVDEAVRIMTGHGKLQGVEIIPP